MMKIAKDSFFESYKPFSEPTEAKLLCSFETEVGVIVFDSNS